MNLTQYAKRAGGTGTASCPILATTAMKAKCSPGTLYQIALGHKPAGPKLAGAIEGATGGAVSRHELRPDVFGPAPKGKAA